MSHETNDRRYRETMEAIHLWTNGLEEGALSPGEALGIAKAFLTHASLAIVAASGPGVFTESEQDAAERLRTEFFSVALQFVQERTRGHGN